MIKRLLVLILFIVSASMMVPEHIVYAQPAPTPAPAANPIISTICSVLNWKFAPSICNYQAVYGTTAINSQSSPRDYGNAQEYWLADQIDGSVCLSGATTSQQVSDCISNTTAMKMNNTVAYMFDNKPADIGLYMADVGHTLGFVPQQVYAQGIGFTGMEPLLPIWKAFRNIAYLLMALIMIVLGFMIMFRKKIDPKTVVTAQNAIPRVIVTLILITFSYAIVGFMIDLMYVLLFFIIAVFKSTGYLPDPGTLVQHLGYTTKDALYGQGSLIAQFFNINTNPYRLIGITASTGQIMTLAGALFVGGLALLATPAAAAGPVISIAGLAIPLIQVLVAVVVLFLFIRLLAFFLSSYIQIIIALLLSPFQILMEAIPGTNSFTSWISNLTANLLVFPIGGAMFMLSAVFNNFSTNPTLTGSTSLWAPPYGGLMNNTTSIGALLSLGILFAIPNVAGSVKEALKAKPAIGMPSMGGGAGSIGQALSYAYYIKMLSPSQFWDTLTGQKGGHEGGK